MRVIFSRKGFDSGSGGGPSPIIGGRPLSLPIPAVPNSNQHSATRYCDIGLGDHAARMGKAVLADDYCHHDPFFTADGRCAFGQEAAAQGHLAKQGIGPGDIFLFFGLFAGPEKDKPHHRIFGHMIIADVRRPGAHPSHGDAPDFAPDHPHYIVRDPCQSRYKANNTVYLGHGAVAHQALAALRLTADDEHNPDRLVSLWQVPPWLKQIGLTYHGAACRWKSIGNAQLLRTVGRGQEFVAHIGEHGEARAWLKEIVAAIQAR